MTRGFLSARDFSSADRPPIILIIVVGRRIPESIARRARFPAFAYHEWVIQIESGRRSFYRGPSGIPQLSRRCLALGFSRRRGPRESFSDRTAERCAINSSPCYSEAGSRRGCILRGRGIVRLSGSRINIYCSVETAVLQSRRMYSRCFPFILIMRFCRWLLGIRDGILRVCRWIVVERNFRDNSRQLFQWKNSVSCEFPSGKACVPGDCVECPAFVTASVSNGFKSNETGQNECVNCDWPWERIGS